MPLPKTLTDGDLIRLAYNARETLRARIKAIAREHGDRIKQLDTLMQRVNAHAQIAAAHDPATGSLSPDLDRVSIDPATEKLLLNPAHDL